MPTAAPPLKIDLLAPSAERATLRVYDDIGAGPKGGTSAKAFAAMLDAVKAPEILLRINSAGGSAFEGLAMHAMLRDHPAKVTARVDGLAASAATLLTTAADRVEMARGSMMMVHNPSGAVVGPAATMRETADALDKLGGQVRNLYAERTGRPADEMGAMMDASTWMTAEEAVEGGFADAVLDAAAAPVMSAAVQHLGTLPAAAAALLTDEPAPDPPAPGGPALSADVTAERDRISNIVALCRGAKIADGDAQKFINDGASLESVRKVVLDRMCADNRPPGDGPTDDDASADAAGRLAADLAVSPSIAGFGLTAEDYAKFLPARD